ncbi:hypothetical protein SEVIR_3G260200v4 [Setaria viridis]|uniref:Uncharacterized protein n=1 Tax=Setaria viridis TaxID=4556 RepID=A0A4U6VGC9_SETVI|nr:hypothetical protein SEVIR_3G260200v2 [Setaria viridis]
MHLRRRERQQQGREVGERRTELFLFHRTRSLVREPVLCFRDLEPPVQCIGPAYMANRAARHGTGMGAARHYAVRWLSLAVLCSAAVPTSRSWHGSMGDQPCRAVEHGSPACPRRSEVAPPAPSSPRRQVLRDSPAGGRAATAAAACARVGKQRWGRE